MKQSNFFNPIITLDFLNIFSDLLPKGIYYSLAPAPKLQTNAWYISHTNRALRIFWWQQRKCANVHHSQAFHAKHPSPRIRCRHGIPDFPYPTCPRTMRQPLEAFINHREDFLIRLGSIQSKKYLLTQQNPLIALAAKSSRSFISRDCNSLVCRVR